MKMIMNLIRKIELLEK